MRPFDWLPKPIKPSRVRARPIKNIPFVIKRYQMHTHLGRRVRVVPVLECARLAAKWKHHFLVSVPVHVCDNHI